MVRIDKFVSNRIQTLSSTMMLIIIIEIMIITVIMTVIKLDSWPPDRWSSSTSELLRKLDFVFNNVSE